MFILRCSATKGYLHSKARKALTLEYVWSQALGEGVLSVHGGLSSFPVPLFDDAVSWAGG